MLQTKNIEGEIEEERVGFLVERKTVSDLALSMNRTDNRLEIQCAELIKLKREHPEIGCGLLVEGELTQAAIGNRPIEQVQKELLHLWYLGIQVWYTKTSGETVHWIREMLDMVNEKKDVISAQDRYLSSVRLFKLRKGPLDSHELLKQSVMIIDKITPEHANAIAEKYKNMARFTRHLTRKPNDLLGMVIPGKKHKIGKALARRLYTLSCEDTNKLDIE
jgi:ERCC4-type nuclease